MGDLVCTLRRKTPKTEENLPKVANTQHEKIIHILSNTEIGSNCNLLSVKNGDSSNSSLDLGRSDNLHKYENSTNDIYLGEDKFSNTSNTLTSLSRIDTKATSYRNEIKSDTENSSSESYMIDSFIGNDISDDDDSLFNTIEDIKEEKPIIENTLSCFHDKKKSNDSTNIKKEITFNNQVEVKNIDTSNESKKEIVNSEESIIYVENKKDSTPKYEPLHNEEDNTKPIEKRDEVLNLQSNISEENFPKLIVSKSDQTEKKKKEQNSNKIKIAVSYPFDNSDIPIMIESKTKEEIVNNKIEDIAESKVRDINIINHKNKKDEIVKKDTNISKLETTKLEPRESIASSKMSNVVSESNKITRDKSVSKDSHKKKKQFYKKNRKNTYSLKEKPQIYNKNQLLLSKTNKDNSKELNEIKNIYSENYEKNISNEKKNIWEKKNSQ